VLVDNSRRSCFSGFFLLHQHRDEPSVPCGISPVRLLIPAYQALLQAGYMEQEEYRPRQRHSLCG
jgi:hypothetical protein